MAQLLDITGKVFAVSVHSPFAPSESRLKQPMERSVFPRWSMLE